MPNTALKENDLELYDALLKWRTAEIERASIVLGIRQGDLSLASDRETIATNNLRIVADKRVRESQLNYFK